MRGWGVQTLESPLVVDVRKRRFGRLNALPVTRPRWYHADLEKAQLLAGNGDLSVAAELMDAALTNGTIAGLLSTRTRGVASLPVRFVGDSEVCDALQLGATTGSANDEPRSLYAEMCAPSEVSAMVMDKLLLGVALGELVKVDGYDYPILMRHSPQFVRYDQTTNSWRFKSAAGEILITPGNRWVLHCAGRDAPWMHGIWRAVGRAYIDILHAQNYAANWRAKFASPGRFATMPHGATGADYDATQDHLIGWGSNTAATLPPGYDVKLVESTGRGWESFSAAIKEVIEELTILIAGQLVSTTGGKGFGNASVFDSIRSDLVQNDADDWSRDCTTQILPQFVEQYFGESDVERSPTIVLDSTPPKDRNSEASALTAAATAIKTLREELAMSGRKLDVGKLCTAFNIPIVDDTNGDGEPDAGLEPLPLDPADEVEVDTSALDEVAA